MHSICTLNHTTRISYPLSHSVKQVFYPQSMDEETEAKWVPKFFGTELRKASGDNYKEWVAGPPSRKPQVLGLTLNRKLLQLQIIFISGFLTSVVFLCVWRKQLFEVQMLYQTSPVYRWQNRDPKKSHHAQDLPLPGPFKTHEMFWVDTALSHPHFVITNSMDTNPSKLQEIVKDRRAWRAAVHGVTRIQAWLSDWTTPQL